MNKTQKKRTAGSLLFETFVALMFLSIGIVAPLRVFGESLYLGRMNQERSEVQRAMNEFLFPWFANPGGVQVSGGSLVLPLEVPDSRFEYSVSAESQNLKPPETENSETTNQTKKQQTPITAVNIATVAKLSEYYKVHFIVTRDQTRDVLDLNTIIFKMKKSTQKK